MLRYPVSGIPSKVVPVLLLSVLVRERSGWDAGARMCTLGSMEPRFGYLKAGTAFSFRTQVEQGAVCMVRAPRVYYRVLQRGARRLPRI